MCFPNADKIVILKDGAIAYSGTYADGKDNEDFKGILGSNDEIKESETNANTGNNEDDEGTTKAEDIAVITKNGIKIISHEGGCS